MISKTALDGEGIFQLGLVQDLFKKMKIPLSNVKVIGEYFDLDLRFRDSSNFDTHFQRFHNFIVNWRLCPAVGTRIRFNNHPDPAPHSVVILWLVLMIMVIHTTNAKIQTRRTEKSRLAFRIGKILIQFMKLFLFNLKRFRITTITESKSVS